MILWCKLFLAIIIQATSANYCNWNGCNGVPQGCCDESRLIFCNGGADQCQGDCGGQWCDGAFSYCSWSTCDGVIRSSEWCNAEKGNCEGACGGMWCTNGGGPIGSLPTQPGPTPTVLTPTVAPISSPTSSGTNTATTTRYWDCSGGACGCAYLPFGLGTDSRPAHCYSNAMFAAPTNNQYGAKFYGTAAVSQELFGYNTQWLGEGCGSCFRVTGTSNIPGAEIVETTLVLKAANLCPPENPACSGNKVHFDIAAPGFDYTPSSFANTCQEREASEKEAFGSCGYWMINSQDPKQNCDCGKFDSPVLEAGCNNFLSLNWDNPTVEYEAVECPIELDRLNCWEENGNQYPFEVPGFCANNLDGPTSPVTPSSPVASPTKSPTKTPTKFPTKAPTTSLPTKLPVSNPTKAPTTASPTKAPTKSPSSVFSKIPTSESAFCCSNNFKDCNVSGWCGESKERCNGCNSNNLWMEQGSCSYGIAKWMECTNNVNGCCAPATCQGNQWYRHCV